MTWQDIKAIVEIADNPVMLDTASAEQWSQERYYTEVLNEYLKIKVR